MSTSEYMAVGDRLMPGNWYESYWKWTKCAAPDDEAIAATLALAEVETYTPIGQDTLLDPNTRVVYLRAKNDRAYAYVLYAAFGELDADRGLIKKEPGIIGPDQLISIEAGIGDGAHEAADVLGSFIDALPYLALLAAGAVALVLLKDKI